MNEKSASQRKSAAPANTGKIQARGDTATRFKPGTSGNPSGRKPGSRNKLTEAFISALALDFDAHGPAIIAKVRKQNPVAYLRLCASLVPKQIELAPENPFSDLTDAELDVFIPARHVVPRLHRSTQRERGACR